MKNTKRFLALVLALTMCVATLATVSAATTAWYAAAVDFIESCGIDTIGSKASAKITRNDFVYWIAKVVTHQVADGAWDEAVIQDEVSFTDVTSAHHVAAIANSQQMGYLRGDGEGKFYPDDSLTLAQVSAIVVRVMGYESKVSGLTQDWKYNYMLVANLYCNAFDSTFMAQTGTADPDYELSYGEAAYILATIMNFPAKPATALESLTADGYDLGAWFRGNSAGTSTYTATVTNLDYVTEWNGDYVLHSTDIIDTTGTVDLVFVFADGSTEVVRMDTLDFQGYIRVSQGLSAEVDWRNEEVYSLSTYVTNGTMVSVRVDNASGEFLSIKVLDNSVVDTFAVLKATASAKYVPWLANKAAGSADYTMELPNAYTDDVHFQFVDVAYAADGTVTSAAFQIGTTTYNIASTYVGSNNLVFYTLQGLIGYGTNEPDEVEFLEETLTTPLTAAEVYDLLPTTATGMARFVITDVDGDGYYDVAVITDNFKFTYRSKLNSNPVNENDGKVYPMGAVVAGYKVTTVPTGVSTDIYGLGDPNNEVTLVVPSTNQRNIVRSGNFYLSDYNPNNGSQDAMLPSHLVTLPFELKSAYIESATALAVDGYYRVVLVNLDGTRTTAYMPIPTGTAQTADVTVSEWDEEEQDYVPVEYTDLPVYKTTRGWTMYRLDEEFDSVEGWYAYEDNDTYIAGEPISTNYLGESEVETAYEYVVYDFIPMTTDVAITIAGVDAVVTLDSSTWVPFLTDYTRANDGGPNGALVDGVYVVNVDDTAAWMVNKYIKYAVDADGKVVIALDTTKAAKQQGLIIAVDKTDTGANTFNVTLGITGDQATGVAVNYGETRWSYNRWGAWHVFAGTIGGSGSASSYLSDAYNKFTENERFALIGLNLSRYVKYVSSQWGNLTQLAADRTPSVQNKRNTAAYFANTIKHLRAALLKLTADELAELTVDTTFEELVGTEAETTLAKEVIGRYIICLGTPAIWATCNACTTVEAINDYLATENTTFDVTMTIGEFLTTLTNGTVDGETWLAALQATDGDEKLIARGTYLYEELQQACDVYISGYWDNVKTVWDFGNNYISEALALRGVKSVVTKEVRASASSLLDWDNYEAYNRIFKNDTLVHDIAVDDVLEGYHLSYGEFYQDAGDLAILKYIGNDLDETDARAHFYQDSEYVWKGYYFSANNALGDQAWESKGVMHYKKATLSESSSFRPVSEVVVIEGPTLVEGSERALGDDPEDYTAEYEVKFARNPYYKRTSNPAYTKYWSTVTTAVVTGDTIAREGKTYYTYIPVVDAANKQLEAKDPQDVRYWENLGVDALNVDAKYKVIDGLVFKINTITENYVYDADNKIIKDTTIHYDDIVRQISVEEDVPVKDEEVKTMVTVAPLTKGEEGYFPNAFKVTFEGETYIASPNTPIVVMAPDYKTGDVQGTAWTAKTLYEANLGVWAARKFVAYSGNSLEALTFIGETISLTAAPVDPGTPTPPTTTDRTVFVANGESVIEQLETGNSYVVKSLYSAVELPSGTEVGSVSVGYSTYVAAKAATTIAPVIEAGKFYLIDKDNNIKNTVAITWYTGKITSATTDGTVKAVLNGADYEGKDLKWAFFYMDLDHTYLALASETTSVQVASEATAKTAVTTAKSKAATAKTAYENAVATGLSAAKIASYKEAYDSALAAVTAAEETAVAKYLNGTFWGVENSPAYNYLVIGKLIYQDNPDPITFKYTVINGTYCVIVNSFFNNSFAF